MLPFMIPRLFRPLMLEAWHLTNTDFGTAFFAYGIWAMISYLLGGPFADRFQPRVLISTSLIFTALGGVALLWSPSAQSLMVIYGFFGVSTIFLMWGALIKTTHIAGGERQRSLAMGLLDGGRGLAAAAFSSLLVAAIALTVPELKTPQQQTWALEIIYFSTVGFTLLVAACIWLTLKNFETATSGQKAWTLNRAVESLRNSKVWLLSVVVLGAYCGYKSIDNFPTYLVTVHDVDLARSSQFSSVIFWLRPVSAFVAGAWADQYQRKNPSGRFLALFLLLLLGALSQLFLMFNGLHSFYFSFAVLIFSASFAFALRAIYFSVFGDLNIPSSLVGTVTGIVSFVGFMPDIFFGLVTGKLIDQNPGELGFQYAFLFTAVCLFMGALASFALYRKSN